MSKLDKINKYDNLIEYVKQYKKVAIAFSGGVDSTFLLYTAVEAIGSENVIAITINSSMYAGREMDFAKKIVKNVNVKHIILQANEYSIPEFVENGPKRCYYCKKAIFTSVLNVANECETEIVFDGSNASDTDDYRPGKIALKELGIKSPLLECDLSKDEIRALAKERDIPVWNRPSYACLASRVPYYTNITPKILSIVENSENFLMDLGFFDIRVRYYGDTCRIEVPTERMTEFLVFSEQIVSYFKSLGFLYVTMDLDGRKTGTMNYVIANEI